MKKALRITSWVLASVLIIIIAGFAFAYFSPDFNLYIVRSESMKPAINMGDLIITGPVGSFISGDLEPGSIVTFRKSDDLITHRILSVDETKIVTKGDAAEDPDPWALQASDIQGIYLFKLPYVGYVGNFIQSKIGWFLMIVIPGALLVLWFVKDILKESFSSAEVN